MNEFFDRFAAARTVTALEVAQRYAPDPVRHGFIRCPFPHGNGGQDSEPSLRLQTAGRFAGTFICYACGQHGGSVDLAAQLLGVDPLEAAERICADFRLSGAAVPTLSGKTPERKRTWAALPAVGDFRAYLTRCAERLPGSDGERYLLLRGLNRETVERFRLGFDPAQRRVTLPYNTLGTYYAARAIDDGVMPRYRCPAGGFEVPLFNRPALYGEDCFVCEGLLDAVAIGQAGFRAVATGGGGGVQRLLAACRGRSVGRLTILMDSDDAGRGYAAEIERGLTDLGVSFRIAADALDGAKDAAEALQRHGTDWLRNRLISI